MGVSSFILLAVWCDLFCWLLAAPIPISVNIWDQSSGSYLWINPENTLSNQAPDISDSSSLFRIIPCNSDDPSYFWLALVESSMVVAANFSGDPVLDIASFYITHCLFRCKLTFKIFLQIQDENAGTSCCTCTNGIVEKFHFEGSGLARSISVTDPTSATKLYWSIDPIHSTRVILSSQQAAFIVQENIH